MPSVDASAIGNLDGITVTKSVAQAFAGIGDRLSYTVLITNSSATTRTIQITDTMGIGITPVVSSIPGTLVPPLQPNTRIWWNEFAMPPGGVVTQTYKVDVTTGVTNGDALVNTVLIQEKGDTLRKFDTVTVTVRLTDELRLPQIAFNPVLPDFQNNGFEDGPRVYWQESTKATPGILIFAQDTLPPPIAPHAGAYVAWLGGTANEVSILESPALAIPPTFDVFTLRYRQWIASAESNCGLDKAIVRVTRVDSGVAAQLVDLDLCTAGNTGQWQEGCVDIQGQANQRLTFAFVAELNDTQNSNWFLDEMYLQTGSCAP